MEALDTLRMSNANFSKMQILQTCAALKGQLPNDVFKTIEFMIQTYATYCIPSILNSNPEKTPVDSVFRMSAVGGNRYELISKNISNPVVKQVYDILVDKGNIAIPSALEALTLFKFSGELNDHARNNHVMFALNSVIDYIVLEKEKITIVADHEVIVIDEKCNDVIVGNDLYVLPLEVSSVSDSDSLKNKDYALSYVVDQYELSNLFNEDGGVISPKEYLAVDEYSAKVREEYADSYYNIRDGRGIYDRDSYDINYRARALYNICVTFSLESIFLDKFSKDHLLFLSGYFEICNKGGPGIKGPKIFSRDVYEEDSVSEAYLLNVDRMLGKNHYVGNRNADDLYSVYQLNQLWAEDEFGVSDKIVQIRGYESIPFHVFGEKVGEDVIYSVPGLDDSYYWFPVSPHRFRGYVVKINLTHFQADDRLLGIVKFGYKLSASRLFGVYLRSVWFMSWYRNRKIFHKVKSVCDFWDKIIDDNFLKYGGQFKRFMTYYYEGKFFLFSRTGTKISVPYSMLDEVDVIKKLLSVSSYVIDGSIKESTFMSVTGLSRRQIESLVVSMRVVRRTYGGEKFLYSSYWAVPKIDPPPDEVIIGNKSLIQNTYVTVDGKIIGNFFGPVGVITPVTDTYTGFISDLSQKVSSKAIVSVDK